MSQDFFTTPSIIACVTEIVSSHLSNNSVPVPEVPVLIRSVHAALAELDPTLVQPGVLGATTSLAGSGGIFHLSDSATERAHPQVPAAEAPQRPAVPVEESIQHEYLVCLEDGKRLRMMKRHLRTKFGMAPEDYRAKWGLPRDYPMAAPAVIEQRRVHAATAGLGRKRGSSIKRKAAKGG